MPPSPHRVPRVVAAFALVVLASCHDRGGGGAVPTASTGNRVDLATVREWNRIAIDASGLDHAPASTPPTHTFGHQLGPCRASRAMAIVHVAMFEAVNAIEGDVASYVALPKVTHEASANAALAQAAHDALAALYPSQSARFDADLDATLVVVADAAAMAEGVAVGHAAAAAVLQLRSADGSVHPEPRVGIEHVCSDAPGHWRQDPVSQHPLALGAWWSAVRPFVLTSADQFRCDPPPAIDSPEYAIAYAEAFAFGGDGITTPTLRSDQQTFAAIFWAYDGLPSLCAPPRLYNQVTAQIAAQQGTDAFETVRLLALVNVALADAAIACWDAKYVFDYWRPVCAIRESDPGTGPTGLGDDNPLTAGDATFTPLGAPASNATGPNFTPPFPAYPSGHAAFGGALFQVLRRFYGTDALQFRFVSDEWNGVTRDHEGNVRPRIVRHFATLSEAENENGQGRVWLGIHWRFDATAGITQGNAVGDFVVDHLYAKR